MLVLRIMRCFFGLNFKPIVENIRRRIRRGVRGLDTIVPYKFVRINGIGMWCNFRRPGVKIGELNSGSFENGFGIMKGKWEP